MLLLALEGDAAHPLGLGLLARALRLAAVLAAALRELLLLHRVVDLHLLGGEAVVLLVVLLELDVRGARVDDAALRAAHDVVLLRGGLLRRGLLGSRRALLLRGGALSVILPVLAAVILAASVVLAVSVVLTAIVLAAPVVLAVLAAVAVLAVLARVAAIVLAALPVVLPVLAVLAVRAVAALLRGGRGGRSGSRSRDRLGLARDGDVRRAAGSEVIVEAAGRVALREGLEHDVELLLGEGRHVLLRLAAVLLQRVEHLLVRHVEILRDLVDSVFNHQVNQPPQSFLPVRPLRAWPRASRRSPRRSPRGSRFVSPRRTRFHPS